MCSAKLWKFKRDLSRLIAFVCRFVDLSFNKIVGFRTDRTSDFPFVRFSDGDPCSHSTSAVRRMATVGSFSDLPEDAIIHCATFLGVQDIGRLRCVNKALHETLKARDLWIELSRRHFSEDALAELSEDEDILVFFKERYLRTEWFFGEWTILSHRGILSIFLTDSTAGESSTVLYMRPDCMIFSTGASTYLWDVRRPGQPCYRITLVFPKPDVYLRQFTAVSRHDDDCPHIPQLLRHGGYEIHGVFTHVRTHRPEHCLCVFHQNADVLFVFAETGNGWCSVGYRSQLPDLAVSPHEPEQQAPLRSVIYPEDDVRPEQFGRVVDVTRELLPLVPRLPPHLAQPQPLSPVVAL